MPRRTIPQRELRNHVAAVLREAEQGTEFTVTVRGRAVARLGPIEERYPRVDVPREKLREIFAIPIDGEGLAAELDAAEAPVVP